MQIDHREPLFAYYGSEAIIESPQYGSASAASTTHLACSLRNSKIGFNITHIPYRGSTPAANDLIGGQIDYLCGNLGAAAPLFILLPCANGLNSFLNYRLHYGYYSRK